MVVLAILVPPRPPISMLLLDRIADAGKFQNTNKYFARARLPFNIEEEKKTGRPLQA